MAKPTLDGAKTDIEAVADEIRERSEDEAAPKRRGRPPGTRNGQGKGRDRDRARRAAAKAAKAKAEGKPEPYVRTDEGVAIAGILGGTLWSLSRMLTGCRTLTDDERTELGEALDPVLHKYLPALDDWKAETALVMTVWVLYEKTRPREAESGSAAEVVDDTAQG